VALPLAFVGIVDLIAKRAIVTSFVVDERRTVVAHALDLTYVENRYGAMGLFGDRPALLIALAAIVLVGLWVLLRPILTTSWLAQTGYGLVAGGALGNVVDRLVHGYVVDYIAVPHFYVFNLADAAIALGLAAIAVPSLRDSRRVT
jgi:signal peptidase II